MEGRTTPTPTIVPDVEHGEVLERDGRLARRDGIGHRAGDPSRLYDDAHRVEAPGRVGDQSRDEDPAARAQREGGAPRS